MYESMHIEILFYHFIPFPDTYKHLLMMMRIENGDKYCPFFQRYFPLLSA